MMLSAIKQFRYASALIICSTLLSACALADSSEPGLFGFVQHASEDLTSFPQLGAVALRYQSELDRQRHCLSRNPEHCAAGKWLTMLKQWRAHSGTSLLQKLNTSINKLNYRSDSNNYASEDYWATPLELLKNGGDCEDFAAAKMLALQHLGVPAQSMRVVVLQDTASRQPHAVLAVSHGRQTVILDNRSDRILSDKELPHYVPLYSINEDQWWLHAPVEVADRLFVQAASTTGSGEQISGTVVSR